MGPNQSIEISDVTRAVIQQFLLERKRKGYSVSTVHGIRTTLAKVLQTAVEHGYLETNPAKAIQIGMRAPKQERSVLSLNEVRTLINSLTDPCRTVVTVAVLTGMRIGEILGLRWKRVDSVRSTIEVAETFSDGAFGSPKTRSSRRVIPMSTALAEALESHKRLCMRTGPEDLVFCTNKGTPLSSKNLYNRALAPTCDRVGLARVSWHSFRHYLSFLTMSSPAVPARFSP